MIKDMDIPQKESLTVEFKSDLQRPDASEKSVNPVIRILISLMKSLAWLIQKAVHYTWVLRTMAPSQVWLRLMRIRLVLLPWFQIEQYLLLPYVPKSFLSRGKNSDYRYSQELFHHCHCGRKI